MKLTPSQKKAIEHLKGNLQLIACAGSGKTEVVARHVAHLLKNGLKPENIIGFTFTEKAAAELKDRISERCKEELGEIFGMAEMFVGTIHGFCLDLLKTEIPKFMKYEVLNEVQQNLFIDRNSSQSGLTTTTKIDGTPLKRYVDTGRYKDAMDILREAQLTPKVLKGTSVVDGLRKYRDLLDSHAYLDYSAIMEQAVIGLQQNSELLKRIGKRVKHIIVDEYQDVNPIQECIVRMLHDAGADICVVGDDDQTIYQWRGSDVQNILDFTKNYPKVTQIPLEENFRSSQGIVETAREFITQNSSRLSKKMKNTDAQTTETGDILALQFSSQNEEAHFIAKKVKELNGIAFKESDAQRGLAYSDMAVLLRSVRNNGDPIISAFKEEGIPFVIEGMNHLFDTAEANAARAFFLYLADRPGIDAASLKQYWVDAGLGVSESKLDFAIQEATEAKNALQKDDEKRFNVYSIQRQFLFFLENTELREENVPNDGGEIVFYNLGKFSQLISDFETIHYHSKPSAKYDAFAGFLEHGAENAYPEGWQDNQYATPNAVKIMTVHQAKGMQWPVVFIPALLKNRFPAPVMGGANVWHIVPANGVVGQPRYVGSIEDERRLFYVAMTRSQKFLFMTWAPIAGKNNRYIRASEFWTNILVSKLVKRLPVSLKARARLKPQAKKGISNVVLSFSDLKYFFECPYQFKLRILYGFNAPIHEALGYGKSLHNALAEIHQKALLGDDPKTKDVDKLIGTHLHLPYAYPSLKETLEKSAGRILSSYIAANEKDFKNIEYFEKKIEIDLGEGVTVNGRIDLVRRKDTGEISIVDMKTAERVQAEEVTETQLHIYALGYQNLTGKRADYVEIYELDEGKRKPRSVDDDFIALVKQNVHTAAKSLRENNLPSKAQINSCKICDYRRMCSDCAFAG